MGRPTKQSSRGHNENNHYQIRTYIDGNTVRKTQVAPKRQERTRPATSPKTRRNREKALQMNFAYVIFLTVACVATLFVCINYLKLQAENTAHRDTVATLQDQLSIVKLANDTNYEETISSIDLSKIKDIAMKEYGMIYATQGQIITYNSQGTDYVRQYEDVPKNK